jgi:hypothetical protein
MTAALSREDWRAAAACFGTDTETFFTRSTGEAKAFCARCPVRAECLYDALTTDNTRGIWGGLTSSERKDLPAIPAQRSAALPVLRDLLSTLDPIEDEPEPTERTADMDDTVPAQRTPEPAPAPVAIPVGRLLAWATDHTDAKIRKAATQASDALLILRTRHAADEQVKSIDAETAALEERLAQLRERKAAIAPGRPKAAAAPRDYEPADVRAWAAITGIDVPVHGRVPKAAVDAWRAAGAPTRQSARSEEE